MFSYICLCFVVTGCLGDSSGSIMSKDESQEFFKETSSLSVGCLDEYGLSPEKVEEVKENGKLDDLDPCFFRCLLGKIGFMDEGGMYDHSSAKTLFAKFVKDEDRFLKLSEAMETCLKVNDQNVSAGKQGECERAVLLGKCITSLEADSEWI